MVQDVTPDITRTFFRYLPAQKRSGFQRGFTLIEVMVTLFVLGLLLAIALPNFLGAQERARIAATKTNMRNFQNIVEMYAVDFNFYPDSYQVIATQAPIMKYIKEFTNPVTGLRVSFDVNVDCKRMAEVITVSAIPGSFTGNIVYTGPGGVACAGQVVYSPPVITQGNYAIYGLDGRGAYIVDKNKVFILTNS